MYHTFQASTAAVDANGDGTKPVRTPGSRRISTSNACVECRRRKIRCDGSQPCGQCQWYQHPDACSYSKPTQRVVPSRKLVDKLATSVDQYQSLFNRLFPNRSLESLVPLPREELINLALTLPDNDTSPAAVVAPARAAVPETTADTSRSDGVESLEALEQAPDQDPEVDEAKRHKDKIQGISDDVNGLSLSVDKQSSYVGVSSITAALKVIFKTAPFARPFIAHSHYDTALPSRSNTPPPQSVDPSPTYLPPAEIGHSLIESYFNRIHALMPMIDEQQFWHTWLYGERKDAPWLALLNTVFALGSLASSTSDNEQHIAYFKRARQHLDLETFGSGNILVCQALGLLSGYYLHYINRPNLANNLMGATLRMATVLGLHREYTEVASTLTGNGHILSSGEAIPADIRRRTWWSLFCLDAWATTTTGRPSLGRTGAGITVKVPHVTTEKLNHSQYRASLKLLPLIHNISFCKLATRIQDTLAQSPLLKFEQLVSLDAELVRWHDELPTILIPNTSGHQAPSYKRSNSSAHKYRPSIPPSSASAANDNAIDFSKPPGTTPSSSCPEFLKTPRAVMHWRYQNLRIVLHRPFLLATALRRTPYSSLSAEEKVAVGRCRIIASQTISDISNVCGQELIAGWNAVWMMYQAVMIPLVSLFSHLSTTSTYPQSSSTSPEGGEHEARQSTSTGQEEDAEKWRQQIETAILFFDRMVHWSVAAKKSKDVVTRLYEASKQLQAYNAAQSHQQHHHRHLFPHQAEPNSSAPFKAEAANGMPTQPQSPTGYLNGLNGDTDTDLADFDPNQAQNQDQTQNASFWGLSPNGDAAMNLFWDEMQWDTFPPLGPEMPESSGTGFGMGEFEWFVGAGNGSGMGEGEGWGFGFDQGGGGGQQR